MSDPLKMHTIWMIALNASPNVDVIWFFIDFFCQSSESVAFFSIQMKLMKHICGMK